MVKVSKLIKHIKNGTLQERIMLNVRPMIRETKKKRWQRLTAGRDEIIASIFPGVKSYLFADCILSRAVYMDRFEWRELKFLSEYLQPGDIFVDIGSNFGIYTLIAAKVIGGQGQVLAFEPVSKTFKRLQRNIALNRFKNIQAVQMALSSSAGQVEMRVSTDGHDAWNSLTTPAQGEAFAQEMVQTVTLDGYLSANPLSKSIKMIKIDVEGWENEVMKGARKTLRAPDAPLMQVEFSEPALEAAGSSSAQLIAELNGLGYQLYRYKGKTDKIQPFQYQGEALDCNLYAVKDPHQLQRYLA